MLTSSQLRSLTLGRVFSDQNESRDALRILSAPRELEVLELYRIPIPPANQVGVAWQSPVVLLLTTQQQKGGAAPPLHCTATA
jgi:hypothetical protein